MEKINKECSKHGITVFFKRPDGGFRCTKCNIEAVTKRRQKLKKDAIEYKGGACIKCGYDRCMSALEFHHIDDKNDFSNSIYGKSWRRIIKELETCVLLCANCRREIHEN